MVYLSLCSMITGTATVPFAQFSMLYLLVTTSIPPPLLWTNLDTTGLLSFRVLPALARDVVARRSHLFQNFPLCQQK